MKKIKLSIITINKNNARGLEKTIQSVINQNFTNYEYIIIDGNSTDGSKDILKKYDKKITSWISEPDKGIYNAMNKGIKKAKGEYCLFLNSGDYLVNNKVLNKAFSLNFNEDIVYGNLLVDNKIVIKPYQDITLRKLLKSYIPHPSCFIKRLVFYNHNFYDEKYKIAADWKFFLETLIIKNLSFRYINILITNFESGGISTSSHTEIEKQKIINELFPRIYPDYKYYEKKLNELNFYEKFKICSIFKKILKLLFK